MRENDPLPTLWRRTLREKAVQVAVHDVSNGSAVTFEELERKANSAAAALARLGLAAGDRVLVQMPNSAEFVAAFLATLRLRIAMIPVDSKLPATETDAILRQFGARARITREGVAGSSEPAAGRRDDAIALLKLTSGSTGAPKGIALTEQQLLADCRNICSTMDIRPDDLNFGIIPLSHSYGFDNLVLPLIVQGTPMVVLDAPLPRAILDGLAATRATVFPAVPFLLDALSQLPPPLPELPALRTVISAGAPLTATVFQRFRERFGINAHQFYGSSECGGITYDRKPLDDFVEGCVGTPLDNVNVDLAEVGRVRVRGENVASGYVPRPASEDEIVLADGMFLTGDIGRFDEQGRLHLIGRVAGFINVAGKKVNPVEIEKCIAQMQGVAGVAVIGVADASRTEAIAAVVVCAEGVEQTTEQVLRHCRERLASWKVPRLVRFLAKLPVNQRGKLDRAVLRRIVEEG